jgi:hypothetical protein
MNEEQLKEDQVLQALRALAENDGEREAPPEVEARLLGAFRARRRSGRSWAVIAAAAAALVIAALWWTNRAPQQAVSAVHPVSVVPEAAPPAPAAATITNVARAPRKLARKIAAARQPESREVVTDFFPLMNPAPSFGRGQMLRVQLPAAAMQTVGLPVREEHLGDLVQADVLVGEEGMPRAIRFVRFDVK